jgi:hypothetical protein
MKPYLALGLALAATVFTTTAVGQATRQTTEGDGARVHAKSTCAVPNVLPTAPSAQAQIVQFAGSWDTDIFNATFWREACPSDGSSSILYFRPAPAQGTTFICGGSIDITQGVADYDVRLVQDTTHTPFCDNLAGPTTFVIDQYTDNAQFDNNAALTLTYTGAHNNSYVVSLPAYNTGSATVTPAPGLWWNPTESGTGYALDVKHGVLVVTVYSYTSTGLPIWYIAAGPITGNVFSGALLKLLNGQCISCAYHAPDLNGNDGVMTITFSSPTTATMALPGGRIVPIVPEAF